MPRVISAKIRVTLDEEPNDYEEVRKEMLELVSPDLEVPFESIRLINQLREAVDGEYQDRWIFQGEIDLTDYADNIAAEEDTACEHCDGEGGVHLSLCPNATRLPTCGKCFALPGTHAEDCPVGNSRGEGSTEV